MTTSTERTHPNPVANDDEAFRNYADNPVLAKAAYEFVKDTHSDLKKKRRPFEDVWAECNDAYRTIERKTWFKGSAPFCSSDLRDAILNIVPKEANAIWYSDTPFDLVPVGMEGDDDKLSEINEKVLQWDFRNLKIYLKYIDALIQKAVFGTNIIKTPPHFEMITKNLRGWERGKILGVEVGKKLRRKQTTERMFTGTDMAVLDLFDFWIDPQTVSRGIKDAVEYGDCIESVLQKWTTMRQMQKNGLYIGLEDIESQYVGATGSKSKKRNSNDSSLRQRVKKAGHIEEVGQGGQGESGVIMNRANHSYEMKECYCDFDLGLGTGNSNPQRVLITVAADTKCVRIQKWHGDKPYLSSRHIQNGYNKEFYGTGIIEPQLYNHYESNATRKQIIYARTMGLNMEMLRDQTGFQNKPDKLHTAPNKIHYVRNIAGVKQFEKPIGQILQSAIAHETNLKSEKQTSTGNTPYIQGTDTSRINDTASGIAQLTQAGNEKFSMPIKTDEVSILEPFVKRSLQNNVTYRKDAFVLRLSDKKPIKVEPHQLSANFDVFAKGASELQNRELRQRGMMSMWQLSVEAAQLEQALYGQPLTKFHELKKEIYANLGISQPDQFLLNPEDIAQQQGGEVQELKPDMEWVLLQRMAKGEVPPQPILIQPGEDYREHYQDHKAKTLTEEFKMMPPQVQLIWQSHLNMYDRVLKLLDKRNQEKQKEEQIEQQEVAHP